VKKLFPGTRPNWLSLSTTFFNKASCHKVPIPLYDILHLDEEKLTVRVEPMVSVGDITRCPFFNVHFGRKLHGQIFNPTQIYGINVVQKLETKI
jgi:hypothetical protein